MPPDYPHEPQAPPLSHDGDCVVREQAVCRCKVHKRVVRNGRDRAHHAGCARLCRYTQPRGAPMRAGERGRDGAVAHNDGNPERGEDCGACARAGVHRAHAEEHEGEVARRRYDRYPYDYPEEPCAVCNFCGCRTGIVQPFGWALRKRRLKGHVPIHTTYNTPNVIDVRLYSNTKGYDASKN